MSKFFEDIAAAAPEWDGWTDWNVSPRHLICKWCKIDPDAKMPTAGSERAAGYDIYALTPDPIRIMPGQTRMIATGWSMTPPAGYFGAIFARSGLASKHGIRPANCVAVIDEDYTGHVMVPLHNDSDEPFVVDNGDRIAQLVFLPYVSIKFEEVSILDETERASGGFGSTGSK